MMIADLPKSTGALFTGTFRVMNPRRCIATNGTHFVALSLEDMTGALKAYAWSDRYHGLDDLAELQRIRVKGRLRYIADEWRADLLESGAMPDVTDNPVRLLPARMCRIPGSLRTLHDSIEALTSAPLRDFVYQVFCSDEIALPFISIPASRRHHHSHPGGLLEHSLECMEIVRGLTEAGGHVRDLGLVAALFHDIGKVKMFSGWGCRSPAWSILHHDAMTMELLAPFLTQLDREWQDGGIALRYLWSWRMTGNFRTRQPLMAVAEAVWLADRMSSTRNAEFMAFKGRPEWQRFARLSDDSRFWRPRPSRSEIDQVNGFDELAINRT